MPRHAATTRSQSLGWVRLSSFIANDEYAWRLMHENNYFYCIPPLPFSRYTGSAPKALPRLFEVWRKSRHEPSFQKQGDVS